MSAITNFETLQLYSSLGHDGIRRYKTRCKVLIDRHNQGEAEVSTLVLYDEVYAVDTSKTIKGPGQATVSLLPVNNYLNVIFPNDYINIYFDIGDGSGWTRTFFGFVDRVEETYIVQEDGTPRTTYRLVCTDFYKALERTMIYFNPQLAGRPDFQKYDFSYLNLGGLGLLSKGVVAGGSPPDVINNLLFLLLGFGTQFLLPSSYQPGDTQRRLRELRAKQVFGRLTEDSFREIGGSVESYKALRAKELAEATNTLSPDETGTYQPEEVRISYLMKELNLSREEAEKTLDSKSYTQILQLVAEKKIKSKIVVNSKERSVAGSSESLANASFSILENVVSSDSSLIDILDTFTFVERRAIDGFVFGQPVWQKQGSLATILTSFSNEAVNELFFDLRPLSAAGGDINTVSDSLLSGPYSTSLDDKSANRGDVTAPHGITYIPAVVMREYPFSTIEGINLDNVNLELINKDTDDPETIKYLYFGAIFNDGPNEPGRHVIETPNINVSDIAETDDSTETSRGTIKEPTGTKHLDVAVISEREVMKTTLGRGDTDHFNLFEFFSDNILGSDQRFYMRDMLPVITPIHMLRNGIRVRSVTTRAARFSISAVKNMQSKDFVAEQSKAEAADNRAALSTVLRSEVLSPPVNNPSLVQFIPGPQSSWLYRDKPDSKDGPVWIFHHGIDIGRKKLEYIQGRENEDIEILAIADGDVVISAPAGAYDGYGNIVVIKHYFEEIGYRYSVYAHLSKIFVGAGAGKGDYSVGVSQKRWYCAKGAPGVSNPKARPQRVYKGQAIGTMGNTGTSSFGTQNKYHLHFEIDRMFPSRNDKSTPRYPLEYDSNGKPINRPFIPYDFNFDGTDTSVMVAQGQNSCDPVLFFARFGVNLQNAINSNPDVTQEEPLDEAEDDLGSGSPEETVNRPKEDKEEETGTKLTEDPVSTLSDRTTVDTASSRRQIIRWALLQDHWYQHNLEYLSGRIDMRGAPEIRVGYRLDITERNMSYYVEAVNHTWTYPNHMLTSLSVSRGQPNNPYPVYVYPPFKNMGATDTQRRTAKSRLATYFVTPDPVAIRRSLFLRDGKPTTLGTETMLRSVSPGSFNLTDSLFDIAFQQDTGIALSYDEVVVPAGAVGFAKPKEKKSSTVPSDEISRQDSITGTDVRPPKQQ